MVTAAPWVTLPVVAEIFAVLNQSIPIPARLRTGWLLTVKAYATLDDERE